ncbi:MAG: T9SS type A sorting domain-containing protein [Dysgonomonas sp.]
MKRTIGLLTLLGLYAISYGQINITHSTPRIGDEIIKQQVEYKDPGRSGENVIWNFSTLKEINPEYKIKYIPPFIVDDKLYVMGKDTFNIKDVSEGELVAGYEHQTRYYYQCKDGEQYILGHENPTTLLHYNQPVRIMSEPMKYGQEINNTYSSYARYSNKIDIYTEGEVNVKADAYGIMILPSGDTLRNVIRIKTQQTYIESDTLRDPLNQEKLNMIVDNYKWYSKGYRYPIFETVRTRDLSDTTETAYYSTAFFYPPQEHYYLEDDYENLAVLDSLDNINNRQPNKPKPDPNDPSHWLENNFTYNYYPNPVITDLYVEYYLEASAEVGISVYNIAGTLIKSIDKQKKEAGFYEETIDCISLPYGSYLLQIKVNNEIINQKFIKR